MVSQDKYFAQRSQHKHEHEYEHERAVEGRADVLDPMRETGVEPAALSTLLVAAILGTVACGLAFLNLASLI